MEEKPSHDIKTWYTEASPGAGKILMAQGPFGPVEPLFCNERMLSFENHGKMEWWYLTRDGACWKRPVDEKGNELCYNYLDEKPCDRHGCKYSHGVERDASAKKPKSVKKKPAHQNPFDVLME